MASKRLNSYVRATNSSKFFTSNSLSSSSRSSGSRITHSVSSLCSTTLPPPPEPPDSTLATTKLSKEAKKGSVNRSRESDDSHSAKCGSESHSLVLNKEYVIS